MGKLTLSFILEVFYEKKDNNFYDDFMGNRDEKIYTVYGYSDKTEEYVVFGSTKTNVNVAISYDENSNISKIYMATPIISEKY